jgi:hypothetical protein
MKRKKQDAAAAAEDKRPTLTGNAAYIARLRAGESVSFRSKGNSMTPRIKSGQKCTYTPVTKREDVQVGDMVFCRVKGNIYTHLITAIRGDQVQGFEFQISNNRGRVNGWTSLENIYGKVVLVEN